MDGVFRFGLLMGLLTISAVNAETPSAEYEPAIKPKVKQLPDGRLDLGGVIVDPEAKTATIPVKLNTKNDGELIEYLLVHENGKTHESLLTSNVQPFHLHTAMLLLGVTRAGSPPIMSPPDNLNDDWLANAPPPKGPRVALTVLVDGNRFPVSGWIWDEARQATMTADQWVYTGSYFQGAAFIAEVDGSFASLINDPAALINSGDIRRASDDNWFINMQAATLPEPDQPLLLELKLLPQPVDAAEIQNKVKHSNYHED